MATICCLSKPVSHLDTATCNMYIKLYIHILVDSNGNDDVYPQLFGMFIYYTFPSGNAAGYT